MHGISGLGELLAGYLVSKLHGFLGPERGGSQWVTYVNYQVRWQL